MDTDEKTNLAALQKCKKAANLAAKITGIDEQDYYDVYKSWASCWHLSTEQIKQEMLSRSHEEIESEAELNRSIGRI